MYKQVGASFSDEYPLRQRGNICTAWNIGIVSSLVCLGSYIFKNNPTNCICNSIITIYLFVLLQGMFTNRKRTRGIILTALFAVGLVVSLFIGFGDLLGRAETTVLLVSMAAYLIVYLLFRDMNYEQMTDMLDSMGRSLNKIWITIQLLILGKETAKALHG
jgi:hypothetical protein